MKQLLFLLLPAWGILMLELGRPDLLAPGSLLIPVVLLGMLWRPSGTAILAGGSILLLDWIVRPTVFPVLPVLLTLAVVLLLPAGGATRHWSDDRRRALAVPDWLRLPMLSLIGVSLLLGPGLAAGPISLPQLWLLVKPYLLITLPGSLLLAGLLTLASEFGLRRRDHSVSFRASR